MLPRKALRRADIFASSLMIGLGVGVIVSAAKMPWTSTVTGSQNVWYVSPGLFPAVVGALLILFNLKVLSHAIKDGGADRLFGSTFDWIRGLGRNDRVHRVVLITVLMAVYVFGAVGRVNFLLASGLFLFTSIALFWWGDGEGKLQKKIPLTILVAVAVPYLFTYLFQTFLFVPMP